MLGDLGGLRMLRWVRLTWRDGALRVFPTHGPFEYANLVRTFLTEFFRFELDLDRDGQLAVFLKNTLDQTSHISRDIAGERFIGASEQREGHHLASAISIAAVEVVRPLRVDPECDDASCQLIPIHNKSRDGGPVARVLNDLLGIG